jgi:hypothetical protein
MIINVSVRRKAMVQFSNWKDAVHHLADSYGEDNELTFTITNDDLCLRIKNLSDHMFGCLFEDGEAMRLYFKSFADTKGPG